MNKKYFWLLGIGAVVIVVLCFILIEIMTSSNTETTAQNNKGTITLDDNDDNKGEITIEEEEIFSIDDTSEEESSALCWIGWDYIDDYFTFNVQNRIEEEIYTFLNNNGFGDFPYMVMIDESSVVKEKDRPQFMFYITDMNGNLPDNWSENQMVKVFYRIDKEQFEISIVR